MPRPGQGVAQRRHHQPAGGVGFAEPDLGLGGVDVDVHALRVAGQEQHRRRVPPCGKHVEIARPQRPDQQLVADRAAIDIQVLRHRRAARIGRQSGQPGQLQPVAGRVQRDRVVDELAPHDAADAGGVQVVPRLGIGAEQDPARVLVGKGEGDARLGHRQAADDLGDGLGLGAVAAQEFQPRGGGEEQVAQLDHRAAIAGGGTHRADAPGLDGDLGRVMARRAAGEGQPRHRPEAGQRLAAKAEAADRQQVRAVDLRGRVPGQRQRQVGGRHPAAIVGDPDQPLAATRDGHLDAPGAGVERVFHQFLDRRGRAFDHLAGGDAVRRRLVELADNGADVGVMARHGPRYSIGCRTGKSIRDPAGRFMPRLRNHREPQALTCNRLTELDS